MDENGEFEQPQVSGYIGEHNARRLEITLNTQFASNDYDYITVAFDTGGMFGKSVSNEIRDDNDAPLYRSGNKIYCSLTQALTSTGVLSLQLSAHIEEGGLVTATKKSGILNLTFKPSIPNCALPTNLETDFVTQLNSAIRNIELLSSRVTTLEQGQPGAGNCITIENGLINVSPVNTVFSQGSKVPSCNAIETYADFRLLYGAVDYCNAICASTVANLVRAIDSNCLGVYANSDMGLAADSLMLDAIANFIFTEGMLDKYILIVPMNKAEDVTLFANSHNFSAGNIYKIGGDYDNSVETVTAYTQNDFPQLLGLGA